MRILLFTLLTLGAAPALAQPDAGAQMFPLQPADKVGAPVGNSATEIERELKDFARRLGAPALTKRAGFSRVFGVGAPLPVANQWARELNSLLQGATLQIDEVRILSVDGGTLRTIITYRFRFPERVRTEAQTASWERPHREIVRFKWNSARRAPGTDPDVAMKLDDAAAVRATNNRWGWEIVATQAAPPALEKNFYALDDVPFWANAAYHLKSEPVMTPATSPGEHSLRKLRELAISTQWLTQENDGRYALAPDLISALMPYLQNFTAFSLPNSKEFYTFNGKLLDLHTDQVTAPDATVLFYEGQNETPIFRYNGRAAIGFADGHAALVSLDEAKQLIWKP